LRIKGFFKSLLFAIFLTSLSASLAENLLNIHKRSNIVWISITAFVLLWSFFDREIRESLGNRLNIALLALLGFLMGIIYFLL